jgi:aromatic-L-amino-acid decarboxylase
MSQPHNPLDLQEFKTLGHELVDWIADYLQKVEGKAVFPKLNPRAVEALFDESLPTQPTAPDTLMREVSEKVLPYCCHVNHPGYMGFITSTPTPVGILGDLLSSALNQNVGVYSSSPSAVAVERRVTRWLCDLVGFDSKAGGHLTNGGTLANFEGVKLARDWKSGNRAQHDGVTEKWTVYTSEERHVSVDKAVDAAGLGRSSLRTLPTNDDFSVRIDALEDAIAKDKSTGFKPLCVVAMGGATNTGAIDPFAELRKIADRESMWLHVDAAYGGGMLLSHRWPRALDGIHLADSVTIDPHKWFYAPLDAGAIVVRDAAQLTRSFGMKPAYLEDEMDRQNERFDFYVHGFEQSRRFRALKVWLSFKRYGTDEIGRWVDANVGHALHLYELAMSDPDFEPATRPLMSAICIRYVADDLSPEQLAELHAKVARRIEEGGKFWITTTRMKGLSWFRINPVNFRTRIEHMDGLFDLLKRECAAAREGLMVA